MRRIDRRRRAAPRPREEGRYKWKGVEYELTTPSMILKILYSVDDSKDGRYYPYGKDRNHMCHEWDGSKWRDYCYLHWNYEEQQSTLDKWLA